MAIAALLMAYDQSLAAVLESTRVRQAIGGGAPWYAEPQRYAVLLGDSFQGALGRRAAVLGTLLAAAAAVWALRRTPAGLARHPARRLVWGLLVAFGLLALAPTKWSQHFGDLAGVGAAVLALGLVTWRARPLRDHPRAQLTGWGAVAVVGAVVLAGLNSWPFVSDWFSPTFSTLAPKVGPLPLSTLLLVAGALLVGALLIRSAWARAGGAMPPPLPRFPVPGPIGAAVLLMVLVVQVGGLAKTAAEVRDSYTPTSDAVATATGHPCGLGERLSVETDPAAGLLTGDRSADPALLAVDVGGRTLPGVAVAGTSITAWYALDPAQRSGALPVVLTTAGAATRPGDEVTVEFARGDEIIAGTGVGSGTAAARDVRLPVPDGAEAVRIRVVAGAAGPDPVAAISLPRVPRLTPFHQVVAPGTSALLDWPVAFLYGCLVPAALPDGTATVPGWRVTPPAADPSGAITDDPGFGGPFAAPRTLITEQRMAMYLTGDPLRDPGQLLRWTATVPIAVPATIGPGQDVAGWYADGHALVPGVDTPG